MFIFYRILFLPFKKIQTVRITPYQIPHPPTGRISPLKSTGDGIIYIPSNLQRVEIFSSVSISYLNLQLKTIPQVKEKLAHTVFPTILQEGGEVKLCNVDLKGGGLRLFEFLKGEWWGRAEHFLKVIFNN